MTEPFASNSPVAPPPPSDVNSPQDAGFEPSAALVAGAFLGFVGAGLVALIVANTGLEWTWTYWGDSNGNFNRSTIFRNFGLLALAILGLSLAIWRSILAHQQTRISIKQTDLTEKGLIIDRYQKGAQMLESTELSVRLAGIYALRELVTSDPEETYVLVQSLLCDFVREKSKNRKPDFSEITREFQKPNFGKCPVDLEVAANVIAKLRSTIEASTRLEANNNWRPNLHRANLEEASLIGANFSEAILSEANLTNADLKGANLTNVDMEETNLLYANLTNANLRKATLEHADLSFASLRNADLSEANLHSADLVDGDLTDADFSEADLNGANLTKAFFSGAILSETNLSQANLSGAQLLKTFFHKVHLSDANLTNLQLHNPQIEKIWSIEGLPPKSAPKKFVSALAVQKNFENWPDFVDRIMREQPELGWTVQDKWDDFY